MSCTHIIHFFTQNANLFGNFLQLFGDFWYFGGKTLTNALLIFWNIATIISFIL